MGIIITIFTKKGKGTTFPVGFKTHLDCMAAAAGTAHVMAKEANRKSNLSTITALKTIFYGAEKLLEKEEDVHNGK